ncbi:hypothetical protein [Planobispora takensis]|uniref:Uncharacterized protein n=1 Tax=Planobispora takensis TaxID=1367882 RepID=A0A8J3T310_9ACTN|nr:hypothetical protein [Planobispora takensis]GII00139.1 hypothetical protein Pta02_21470 [Planobispora takensis]
MNGAAERARAIADAVLYEGYLLYPYRASAAKNRVRWQWGVLAPPGCRGESSRSRTELLAEARAGAVLHVRLRFLHLQERVVQDGAGAAVPSLRVAGTEYTTWEEAVEREVDAALRVADLLAGDNRVPFQVPGGVDVEPIPGGGGARLARRRLPLRGELLLRADPLPGPYGGLRLRLCVANTADASPEAVAGSRPGALKSALIAAHVLLSITSGGFLSSLDPPEWAAARARECRNEGMWPVLVGEPGRRDTVLCSPIILYDYPAVAEESPGELFDGTEIDEILTLRTMALTEEEKRQARATDPRAAELIERVDHLPAETLARLHGAVRDLRAVTGQPRKPPDGSREPDGQPGEPWPGTTGDPRESWPEATGDPRESWPEATGDPRESWPEATGRPAVPWWDPGADASVSPETDAVVVAGVRVAKGSPVRLRPGRRADAQDMFLAGRTATVAAVLHDVDGGVHLAVALDGDGEEDAYAAHGRFRYFAPDEVEPL